jgi:hypothetical protein
MGMGMGMVTPTPVAGPPPEINMHYSAVQHVASSSRSLESNRKTDIDSLAIRQEGDRFVSGALLAITLSTPFWVAIVLTARFLR